MIFTLDISECLINVKNYFSPGLAQSILTINTGGKHYYYLHLQKKKWKHREVSSSPKVTFLAVSRTRTKTQEVVFPFLGDLLDQGIKPLPPALARRFFTITQGAAWSSVGTRGSRVGERGGSLPRRGCVYNDGGFALWYSGNQRNMVKQLSFN